VCLLRRSPLAPAEGKFEIVEIDPVHVTLERSENPGEEWLVCIYCDRFFQARDLRIDYLGNRQGCALCECAGFNVAIFQWDTFLDDDPDWPRSISDLWHGRPVYLEPGTPPGPG